MQTIQHSDPHNDGLVRFFFTPRSKGVGSKWEVIKLLLMFYSKKYKQFELYADKI